MEKDDGIVLEDVRTYYVFKIANELYALDFKIIKKVRIIEQELDRSSAGNMSDMVDDINLELSIGPVFDLGKRLGIRRTCHSIHKKVMLVVEILSNEMVIRCGIIVDEIANIVNIKTQDLSDISLWDPIVNQFFVSNKITQRKQVIQVLNIAALFEEIRLLPEFAVKN